MRSSKVPIEGSDVLIIVQKDLLEIVDDSGKSHKMKRSFLWSFVLSLLLRFKLKKIGVKDSEILKKVISDINIALKEIS